MHTESVRRKCPVWRLAVRTTFSAAHALRHYQGKCERLHGHNYGIEVRVKGITLLPDTEILMDFGDLKALLREVLAPLDHQNLNDVPPFDTSNPSSENIARYVWQNLSPRLPEGVTLVDVTIWEKPEQSATYSEE